MNRRPCEILYHWSELSVYRYILQDQPAASNVYGKKRQKLSPKQKIALDVLVGLCAGSELKPPHGLPGRAVKIDTWLAEMMRGTLRTAGKPAIRFDELKDALVARELIGEQDGIAWPAF